MIILWIILMLLVILFASSNDLKRKAEEGFRDYNDETTDYKIVNCDTRPKTGCCDFSMGYNPGCPRINRSRPFSNSEMEQFTGKSDCQIIIDQQKEIEEYRKLVNDLANGYDSARLAGKSVFPNPMNEYVEPLMDPTLAPDNQPVMLGVSAGQLSYQGTCTLDGYGDTVCNPTLLNGQNWFNVSATRPQFILYKNTIGPNQ